MEDNDNTLNKRKLPEQDGVEEDCGDSEANSEEAAVPALWYVGRVVKSDHGFELLGCSVSGADKTRLPTEQSEPAGCVREDLLVAYGREFADPMVLSS